MRSVAGEVPASSVKFTCGMLQKRVWREGAEGEEGQGRRKGAWVTVSCDADEDDFTALWNVGAVAEDFEIDDDVLLFMTRDEFAKSAAEGEQGLASCWASRQYARVKRVDRGGAGFGGNISTASLSPRTFSSSLGAPITFGWKEKLW